MRVKELPRVDEEEHNPIPRRTGHLRREVASDTTHVGLKICTENFAHVVCICVNIFVVSEAQNFCSARGTELLWCQGYRTFKVPEAQVNHSATTNVLGPIRSDKSFIFCHDPTLNQSWGIITLTIIPLWLKCDYLNSFCTIKGVESFKVLNNNSSNFQEYLSCPSISMCSNFARTCLL